MSRRRTQSAMIKALMDESILHTTFIVYAISKVADAEAARDPSSDVNPIINGAAWVSTAQDIQKRLKEFYDA